MRITEIERLSKDDYTGGKSDLRYYQKTKAGMKPLPGGSRFKYYIDKTAYSLAVMLVDPDGKIPEPESNEYTWEPKGAYEKALKKYKESGGNGPTVIGKLSLYVSKKFPLNGAVSVSSITVDEDYRGQGLAMALYGIVINVLKLPLVAGDSQTPGGRKNWLNLASIPGCQVDGFLIVEDFQISTREIPKGYKRQVVANDNIQAEKLIDSIMHLGGEYLGPTMRNGIKAHVFLYPVTVNGAELKNAIKGSKVGLYHAGFNSPEFETGLVARWVG